jgi:mannobiose 2-epimerase
MKGNLAERAYRELTTNILPFWMTRMPDYQYGGYYGRINGNGETIPGEDKGGILTARILWSFSSAYEKTGKTEYLQHAERAMDYIVSHFIDSVYGGTYWTVTYAGKPGVTKKQIYSQAFFLYALTAYHRIKNDNHSLRLAQTLFRIIEEKSFDPLYNGYLEAYSRDWKLLDDLRLSARDENARKTTNTHLHILEGYTALYRVWKNDELKTRLHNLLALFLDTIIDPVSGHLRLFFTEDWDCGSDLISYGHDIEASWLITEAAEALGEPEIMSRAGKGSMALVEAALEGYQPDGSIIYERHGAKGPVDKERHWWPQAETVVGMLNAFALTGHSSYLERAEKTWQFIEDYLVDHEKGEWFWSILPNGSVNTRDDKAGFWKCPYHNTRTCLEIIRRMGPADEKKPQ